VPDESDLTRARTERDTALAAVFAAGTRGAVVVRADPMAEAVVAAVRVADDLADRIRREADRVAKKARAAAEEGAAELACARTEEEVHSCEADGEGLERRWKELWTEAGVEPRSPEEMRHWRRRASEILALAERADGLAANARLLRARRQAAMDELAGITGGTASGTLERLVDTAAARLERSRADEQRRGDLLEQLDAIERREASVQDELASAAMDLQAWTDAWSRCAQELSLPADLSADVAIAKMEHLRAVGDLLRDAADAEASMRSGDLERVALAQDLRVIGERTLPGLRVEDPSELAEAILRAEAENRVAEASRRDRRSRLDEIERHLRDVALSEALAHEELARLMALAGAQTIEGLEPVERGVARGDEIRRELDGLRTALLSLGGGQPLAEVLGEAHGQSMDTCRAELEQLERAIEHEEAGLNPLLHRIGRLEAELERYDTSSQASDAAEDAEACAAEVQHLVEEYVRARLGLRVLERELERQRARHQGPIVGRANELLPELTNGRYTGIRADFGEDDRLVLACVRHDGKSVGVSGLSDGTQDQLYLALRLASLEHYARHQDPPPVVLDDILVHFDEERAGAALRVLGELADTMQILFFTHHARLVTLAKECVRSNRIVLHDLERPVVPSEPRLVPTDAARA
jgi:uncharacterized protein YhaN